MKSMLSVLPFIALTFCCWGLYGPTIHEGQVAMGADGQLSSLWPLICVGIAYFLIAVLYPITVLKSKGEIGSWTLAGFLWSFMAGAAGAMGALGIVLAFKFKGHPVFVMPLVFGLAPVVNTFVTMFMTKSFRDASAIFFVGVAVVAVGAAGVMYFKPSKAKLESAPKVAEQTSESESAGEPDATAETETATTEVATTAAVEPTPKSGGVSYLMVSLFVGLAALSWGSYGAVLHKGQAKMGGSRLRPFLCVGLAYFAIAVIVPLALMPVFPEAGGWNVSGTAWSLGAGTAGALGAMGIIYAFNFGGKPIFVMPLVFGFAPVINTITTTVAEGVYDSIQPFFLLSLLLVICGAVTVLIFAPRPKKPQPAPTSS